MRQGFAILATMTILWAISVSLTVAAENARRRCATSCRRGNSGGQRGSFRHSMSAVFGASTTLTSTGSVNSMHDSYTPFGGGMTILNMGLGEVAPGGVGSGLYGMLIPRSSDCVHLWIDGWAHPEYLGKKQAHARSNWHRSTFSSRLSARADWYRHCDVDRDGSVPMLNSGPHGLSEVLYAFTSASNNNGSAFAGLSANTTSANIALAGCDVPG